MHRRAQSYDDGESLQADVMRFMAIIAFCLIAILALVKHAEPPQTKASAPVEPEPEMPKEQPGQTLAWAEPEPAPPVYEKPTPEPVEEPPVAIESPEPEPELEPEPIPAATPEPEAVPQSTPPVIAEQPPREPTQAPDQSAPAEPEEEGLILRFASDGDFLRLIARGDIRVYAFQETDVLTLSESYRFLDTQSPGQVYELLPPSIPGLIVDALKQARTNIDGYRWGIALPGHISNQIEQHLGRVTRGQLVIDRYGDVHHVAAS